MKICEIEKIFSGRVPGIIGNYKYYSVLVPLVEKDNELNLLFEVRSHDLQNQPGEVCFPGGEIESGEAEEECAIRETVEELGIPRSAIKIIARLDNIHAYSNFTLYSFLGQIEYDALRAARINKDEVESIFYVPLPMFISNEPFIYKMEILPDVKEDFPYEMVNSTNGYNWKKGISEVPIYRFDDRIIWGMTARISHNLAKILRERS